MRSLLTLCCVSAAVLLLGSTEGWSLPACPSDQQASTWTDCVGTVASSKGDRKYVGEFKDDKMHGQGTMTWSWGSKYAGEWKHGTPHGQGVQTYKSGTKYVGSINNYRWHGQGTLTDPDGNVGKGIWENGKLLVRSLSQCPVTKKLDV